MIVLGIETATIEVGAAIYGDEGLISSYRARSKRRHVETLHPLIESLLELSGLGLSDIDAIAVDIGPGLFTGLRVGVAAAKGFAVAMDLPVVACTSTEILLFQCGDAVARTVARAVIPVIDMRRGEVAYEITSGELSRIATVEEFARDLCDSGLTDAILIGDGATRHEAAIIEVVSKSTAPFSIDFAGADDDAPDVVALAHLGHDRAMSGQSLDAASLDALYLRLPDAKANFEMRDGSKGGN